MRRQRAAHDPSLRVEPFGDRVADTVAGFGGSGLTFDCGVLGGWYVARPTFGIQVGLSADVK